MCRLPSDVSDRRIAIPTPLKDATAHPDRYFACLRRLNYPRNLMSLGFPESDRMGGA
jgi:hypothetical protein